MPPGPAGHKAEGAARDVSSRTPFRALVGSGLVAVGAVHILIGMLALQMAWSGKADQEADQRGALRTIAATPVGGALLWIVAIALGALFLWKLTQAWWGYGYESARAKRISKRLGALGGAAMYLVLALTAIRFSVGDSGRSSDQAQQTRAGELLAQPYGQALAVGLALLVIGYAGVLVKRGITASFTKELDGEPSAGMKQLGRVGHIAKGIATGLIGVLFGWAAVTYDPEKAAGLDDSLQLVNQQAAGPLLLALVALGLVAYGLHCFGWARHARH